jgi:hypothetical protein
MSSTWVQLRALIRLRWTMVRSRRVRLGLLALAALVVVIVVGAVLVSRVVPHDRTFNATIVMPTALLVYIGLAVVGPLAAGGGNELFPADEMVPHPIRPATAFLSSLTLTPLNIAWVGQTTTLFALTGYISETWRGLPAALTMTIAFVAAITACGQALAWTLAALRQTRRGRWAVWTLAAAVAVGVLAVLHLGLTRVLDSSPTQPIVIALLQGAAGHYERWSWTLLLLTTAGLLGIAGGIVATAYTLRLPPALLAARQARSLPRRRPAASVRRHLRSMDRAAVWRAPALRRGVLVMGLLPGSAAAAARLDWPAIAMTGGLVTAGAGLLFGVNAFCLDGPGSLWMASLPLDPRDHLGSKGWVTLETCLACSAITIAAAASRARGGITTTGVVTVASAALACAAVVVASCLKSSVARPHRADLRGSRDTPAPPGAMAVHSARLAWATTGVALATTAMGLTGRPAAPLLFAVAVVALALRSALRTAHRYANPANRARVAITVAAG